MVTAKRETCYKCGCTNLINNVYIEEGEPIQVYVECSKCKELVARYTVNCYISTEGYESLLQSISSFSYDSGRFVCKRVQSYEDEILEEFEHCKKLIKEEEDEKSIEEIISESEEEK